MKRICLLGATGSIGQSTLDVIAANPEHLKLHSISGHSQIAALASIAEQFKPARVGLQHTAQAAEFLAQVSYEPDLVFGPEGLIALAQDSDYEVLMAAIVGAAGLPSTLAAAEAGKTIALANKEALVMSGELFMRTVAENQATLLPTDSEHNAIFQSLPTGYRCGTRPEGLAGLWLTCSGGPFRDAQVDFATVTPAQAVAHPNWSMGAKISVDSATLMNKGLEIIEACWLFNVPESLIDVVIHPQSVIHSLVEYTDGSFISQLGETSMQVPIAHCLRYPERGQTSLSRLDLRALSALTFEAPDVNRFPALQLARDAVNSGQGASIVLNAVNELAVADFLRNACRFSEIVERVEQGLEALPSVPIADIDSVIEQDRRVRRWYTEKYL